MSGNLNIYEIKALINDECGCRDDTHKGAAKDIYNLFLSPEVEAKLHAAVSAFCAQVAS